MNNEAYRGYATIDFCILRYKNQNSNQLITYDKVPPDCNWDEWEEIEFQLKIRGFHYYDPGVYSGPYEDSYPMESDTEILDVYTPESFLTQLTDESQLTDDEILLIKDKIAEKVKENYFYCPED
jgi:hypothetical protein